MCSIYQITCLSNGRVYIGSTSRSPKQRWSEHLHALRHGVHHAKHFQRSFDKYGEASMVFAVVETVDDAVFLLAREQFHIWRHDVRVLLNSAPVSCSHLAANDAVRGRVMPPEERQRRSVSAKRAINEGRAKRGPWSDERKAAHSVRLTGRKMPPVSDETRRNISLGKMGKKQSPSHTAASVATRLSWIGKEVSEWIRLRGAGNSYREIERITGRDRGVIAHEYAKATAP